MEIRFQTVADINAERARDGTAYREALRVPSLSAGVYTLPVGALDTQSPHRQDEVYYVVRGRARLRAGAQDQGVAAGSLVFVAAGIEHHFYDVEEELSVLVLFAPAESE
jgi:quercetin dioxygenase-like cupin family protein